MFYRFRPFIILTAKGLGYLPKPMLRFLYQISEPFPWLFFVFVRYVTVYNLCRRVGDNVFIGNHVELRNIECMSIGSNVSINKGTYIDAIGGIEIGDDVSIAHGCSLVSFEHGWSDSAKPIRKNPLERKPISISNDVWIGAGVRILAGARINQRCIVAAGAVVTPRSESESGVLLAGVPATVKKRLEEV